MSSQPQQTFYVVLPAQPEEVASSLRPISRLLQIEEDELQKRLKNPTYQLLRRYARRDNAEGFHNQLHAFGIESFILSDTGIGGALFIWMEKANKGAGGIAFQDFGGQPLYCPFEDIIGICIGTVQRTNASITTLIDLHRKSTPITARIDAGLFDFATVTGGPTTERAFIEALYDPTTVELDETFDKISDHLQAIMDKGLASFPGQFPPPADKLPVPYQKFSLRLFDCYSYLAREERLARLE